MPDPGSSPGQALIRHPEVIGVTGFSDKSENDVLMRFLTFYETINFPNFALFLPNLVLK
jgi:hypothetical protein